jgi:hypothetical protein
VGIPLRTVQAYMQAAQWAKGKSATIKNLPPSLLYIVSARSTPDEFTAVLLKRHEAGDQIDARSVRAELRAIRAAQRKSAGSKIEILPATVSPAQHVIPVSNVEAMTMVMKVVDILVSSLSRSKFEEVKDIITNKVVLNDSNLAGTIAAAFLFAEKPPDLRQVRVQISHCAHSQLAEKAPIRRGETVSG